MRAEDIKSGVVVICVCKSLPHLIGQTATIRSDYSTLRGFIVSWHRNSYGSYTHWTYPSSFELATEENIQQLDESIKREVDQQRRLKHAMRYL